MDCDVGILSSRILVEAEEIGEALSKMSLTTASWAAAGASVATKPFRRYRRPHGSVAVRPAGPIHYSSFRLVLKELHSCVWSK